MLPVSDSGLDLLRSLLNCRFLISSRARDGSSASAAPAQIGFMFLVSDSGLDLLLSLLNFQFLFPAGLTCASPALAWILASSLRFWFRFATLASEFSRSGF